MGMGMFLLLAASIFAYFNFQVVAIELVVLWFVWAVLLSDLSEKRGEGLKMSMTRALRKIKEQFK